MSEIKDILVDYINKNQNDYDINYDDTIDELKELLNEIQKDFEDNDEKMYCIECGKKKDLNGLDDYEASLCVECFKKKFVNGKWED